MPTYVDQTGELAKIAGSTGTAGVDITDEIVALRAATDSIGGVIRKLLAAYSAACVIVIDTFARKIYATTDATKKAALIAAAQGTEDVCEITPDGGQEGRSLKYSQTGADSLPATMEAAVLEQVTAVKPTKTVESLVAAIISGSDAEEGYPIIVIDQENEVVAVNVNGTGISAALAAVTPAATDMSAIELQVDPTEEGTSPLPFEGGAIA